MQRNTIESDEYRQVGYRYGQGGELARGPQGWHLHSLLSLGDL